MRPILAALLALALATPAHAQPATLAVQAAHSPAGRVVRWPAVPGQWAACVFRRDGQVLGCVRGPATTLTLRPGGDANLQSGVAPLVVEVYGDGGLLAVGRSYAVALPQLGR